MKKRLAPLGDTDMNATDTYQDVLRDLRALIGAPNRTPQEFARMALEAVEAEDAEKADLILSQAAAELSLEEWAIFEELTA